MANFRAGKCLLRQRLREAGMTQKQLAERVNLSQNMITHFCAGRKIMNLNTAKAISDVLNCEIEDLYEWEVIRDRSE